MRTYFRPHPSASLPAAALETATTKKVVEKRPPAASLERDRAWRRSGKAMLSVAMLMEGNRLDEAAISAVGQSALLLYDARLSPLDFDGDDCTLGIKKARQICLCAGTSIVIYVFRITLTYTLPSAAVQISRERL